MMASHILAVSGGMGVFVCAALLLHYPLLRLALVAAAGTGAAYVIIAIRAALA